MQRKAVEILYRDSLFIQYIRTDSFRNRKAMINGRPSPREHENGKQLRWSRRDPTCTGELCDAITQRC